LRNMALKHTPKSVTKKQIERMYTLDVATERGKLTRG
jgi:hypothetical protein